MDSREKTNTFDIGKVDFKWVDDTNKLKELKRAYAALKEDGGHYKELEDHLKKKILSLDPKFERHMNEGNISSEERAHLTKDLLQWEDQISQQDHELKANGSTNGDIFQKQGDPSKLTPLQKKKEAEAEKQKGNDLMRSSDFSDALSCYNKSVALNPEDPATYSNRALAQIKLKDFAKAKQDADKALSLKPDYIKAFHRLAKAYEGLGDTKKAIKSFREVLKLEPHNREAPVEISRLEEKLKKDSDSKEGHQNEEKGKENFKRVEIEEDSDDDESEEAQDEVEPEEEEEQGFTRPQLMKRSSSFWEEADTPQEDEDQKKLMAQIKAISTKVEQLKEEAKELHQKGSYEQAVNKYEGALRELEAMGSGMTKVRLLAQIHNNMAACYKQSKDNGNVRKYATLVIQSDTDESNLIGKALWRRGLSFYEDERFQQALADLERARSYGVTQNIGMIIKNIRDHLQAEEQPTLRREQKQPDKEQEKEEESLEIKVKKLKELGNSQFKASDYSSAIKTYSEAQRLYERREGPVSQETKMMVKQCLGNRSLVFYKQGEWLKAVEDCSIILNEFDGQFKKAILRRGICLNQLEKFDQAVRDLQSFVKLEPQNEEAKKELNKALAGFTQQIQKEKKEKEERDKQQKLKHYEARKKQEQQKQHEQSKEQEQIAEQKSENKQAQPDIEEQKEVPAQETKDNSPKRGKVKFNQELVKQANEKAKEKIGKKKPLPINMFEFNNYWGNLRTETKEVRLEYLKSIPVAQIRKIFKTSEINQAHFAQIIDLFLQFEAETKFALTFLSAISKFESFETLVDIQLAPENKKKLEALVQRGMEIESLKKKATSILKKL